ncbi:hypothetical protein p1B21 (plasmid) [Aromatoleum aromaticum EbN1]|uniref:Uncharacterized protein n=1 Tax=Aromatoleum aromaticum (strain DSM 19018 / LMG 30748 / EbN1) TaxID=76114 RepID=Q5NXE8_AROAE|nr:hypothetical protein p1B21 [Aromatoleum aromaticum EbN1]
MAALPTTMPTTSHHDGLRPSVRSPRSGVTSSTDDVVLTFAPLRFLDGFAGVFHFRRKKQPLVCALLGAYLDTRKLRPFTFSAWASLPCSSTHHARRRSCSPSSMVTAQVCVRPTTSTMYWSQRHVSFSTWKRDRSRSRTCWLPISRP